MQINKEKKDELVTVVMPVYNVQAYIEAAINSVLKQTYSYFELLIIDDESPDESIKIIQEKFNDKRIRIIKQENRGLAGARNTGIRESSGSFIAFLDSDDFWDQDKLSKNIALFKSDPENGVVFNASMFVNDSGISLGKIQTPFKKKDYNSRSIFCRNPIGNGSSPVIRKSVLEQISFIGKNKHQENVEYRQYFDESLKQSEDIDCWTRISLEAQAKFSLIDEPLTFYRINNEGLSADVENQYKTWELFIQKIQKKSPQFIKQHASAARAFQCRYIARRCLSQAEGKSALKWSFRALKNNPIALMEESGRTIMTIGASVLMSTLPKPLQIKVVSKLL